MDIKAEYEGSVYTVEFLVAQKFNMCHLGKHWPITTQCVVKRNGFVIGVGEVVKHAKDTDNPYYGRIYSAKKAFAKANRQIWREMRERLWKQILVK